MSCEFTGARVAEAARKVGEPERLDQVDSANTDQTIAQDFAASKP
jgi:hypothetical protein